MAQSKKLETAIDFINQKDFMLYTNFYIKDKFFINLDGMPDKLISYKKQNNIFISDESEITYKFNSDGFRSEEFKKINGKSILTGGCSHTFGLGLSEDMSWPHLLNNNFFNYSLYNIGILGFTTPIIINNVFYFFKKYGIPEYMFLNLPSINRKTYYDKDRKAICLTHDPYFFDDQDALIKFFNKNNNHLYDTFINTCILIKNLENISDILNIKFKWFSWDEYTQELYQQINFKHLIHKSNFYETTQDDKIKYRLFGKYETLAEDRWHPGTLQQFSWAKTFINSL